MRKVVLGPEKNVPSWHWVGFDTCRELSKYYEVDTFSHYKRAPQADVIIFIKQKPPLNIINEAAARKTKLIYCPIDWYYGMDQMGKDHVILKKFNMIISHCERLVEPLKRFNPRVKFIDHNNKYMLPVMSKYKEKGYILWIGGCQYVAYLVKWLKEHPIKGEIKILSDIDNGRAVTASHILANKIGVHLNYSDNDVNGITAYAWNERLQFEMMSECKAAMDIKGEDFNQYNKPPTKAQKFIASGIPFAVNLGSYSAEYFKSRDFNVVSPIAQARWFSKDYWLETRKFGEKLRKTTCIEAVGLKFKEYIDSLFKKG